MNSILILSNKDNRTYRLDAKMGQGECKGALKDVTWHKIPCCPSNAHVLLIHIHSENGFQDPVLQLVEIHIGAPIVRHVYQTIERFLKNGPVLSRKSPLRRPLRLKKLILHLDGLEQKAGDSGGSANSGISRAIGPGSSSDDWIYVFSRIFCILKSTDMLWGCVDHVHMTRQGQHDEFKVCPGSKGYQVGPFRFWA
jgi:hypothetical protein